jgi:uncharacterized membrane protein
MSGIAFCAGIGGVCGLIVALVCRRQPLLFAMVLSAVLGTVVETLLFSVSQAVMVVYPEHHSFTEAAECVFAGMFLDGMFTLIFGGLPAAFFGYVCHRLFSWHSEKPSD